MHAVSMPSCVVHRSGRSLLGSTRASGVDDGAPREVHVGRSRTGEPRLPSRDTMTEGRTLPMQITPTPLPGSALIDLKLLEDDRGFFARTFCSTEFGDAGLDRRSRSATSPSTTRPARCAGMHYQLPPAAEAKLVRCIARRDRRRHRRPAPGVADLPAARSGRADRGQPPRAVRAAERSRTATRPSSTTPRCSTRSASSTRRAPSAACATTTRRSGIDWPLPVTVDLGQGRDLAAARADVATAEARR